MHLSGPIEQIYTHNEMSYVFNLWLITPLDNIPDKKETHNYDFPIKTSFQYENVNCHEIFISFQILLKLECDVDEYLYFPCVGTNTSRRMVNEFWRR